VIARVTLAMYHLGYPDRERVKRDGGIYTTRTPMNVQDNNQRPDLNQSPDLRCLPSLCRGIYNRVAQKVGCDPSYVSRVARGERNSEAVSEALRAEIQLTWAKASEGVVENADKALKRKARTASA
jgi:hypothetical protein